MQGTESVQYINKKGPKATEEQETARPEAIMDVEIVFKASSRNITPLLTILANLETPAAMVKDPDYPDVLVIAQSAEDALRWAMRVVPQQLWEEIVREYAESTPHPASHSEDDATPSGGSHDGRSSSDLDTGMQEEPDPTIGSGSVAISTLSGTSDENSRKRRIGCLSDSESQEEPITRTERLAMIRKQRQLCGSPPTHRESAVINGNETQVQHNPSMTRVQVPPTRSTDHTQSTQTSPTPPTNIDQQCLPIAKDPAEEKIKMTLMANNMDQVVWIMKRRSETRTGAPEIAHPYRMADHMIQKSAAIGGVAALETLQTIYHYWRTNGTISSPNSHGCKPVTTVWSQDTSDADLAFSALFHALQAVNKVGVDSILLSIFHRRLLADLYKEYRRNEALFCPWQAGAEKRPRGVTDIAEVKIALFKRLYVEYAEINRPAIDPRSKKAWLSLHKLLEKGKRWNEMEVRLGSGIFGLIADEVPHSWVERTTTEEFHIWLDFVKEHNQQAIILGQLLSAKLQQALSGHTISTSILRLEQIPPKDLKEFPDPACLFQEVGLQPEAICYSKGAESESDYGSGPE